jgi:hypothetical protein
MNFRSVIGAFKKHTECKKMQNLCFSPDCTISGYRSCEHGFVTKACILLLWALNVDWGSFGAFHKPTGCKKTQNLCFEGEFTFLGY